MHWFVGTPTTNQPHKSTSSSIELATLLFPTSGSFRCILLLICRIWSDSCSCKMRTSSEVEGENGLSCQDSRVDSFLYIGHTYSTMLRPQNPLPVSTLTALCHLQLLPLNKIYLLPTQHTPLLSLKHCCCWLWYTHSCGTHLRAACFDHRAEPPLIAKQPWQIRCCCLFILLSSKACQCLMSRTPSVQPEAQTTHQLFAATVSEYRQ